MDALPIREASMSFEVNGVEVGGPRAYVIYEAGSNHGGELERAYDLVDVAIAAGADAFKLQVRTNESLYTRAYLERPYDSENAYGPTYGSHREALELGVTELSAILDYCLDDIACFATAFDQDAVDLCMELGFPAIKIASGSVTNTPLLAYAARTGVPIFLSTGGCHQKDVNRAVETIRAFNKKLCVMQATATYPSTWEELDLAVVHTYSYLFPDCVIGLSSHVSGIAEGPAAYVLGARVFEKHGCLDRTDKGTDQAFSLEPRGFTNFVRDLRRMEVAIGDGRKKRHMSEADPITKMASSVYTSRKLKAGTVIGPSDICIKSPAAYIPPYEVTNLIGKEVLVDLEEETALDWSLVHGVQDRTQV